MPSRSPTNQARQSVCWFQEYLSITDQLSMINLEMKACIAEMSAGIDYDYNEDLYDSLAARRDELRFRLEFVSAGRDMKM